MKTLPTLFSIALIALTLSACGSGSDSGSSSSDSQSNDGNCGSDVVHDYNTMVIRCKYTSTRDDIVSCRDTAQSFLNKYPDVNCRAMQDNNSSVDQKEFQVTKDKVQSILDAANNALYGNHNGHRHDPDYNKCSDDISSAYNLTAVSCNYIASPRDAKICKQQAENLLLVHPYFSCKLYDANGYDSKWISNGDVEAMLNKAKERLNREPDISLCDINLERDYQEAFSICERANDPREDQRCVFKASLILNRYPHFSCRLSGGPQNRSDRIITEEQVQRMIHSHSSHGPNRPGRH